MKQASYLIIILCFVCCKKSNPERLLPPLTTNGNMTFACLMNGSNLFVTYGDYLSPAKGVIIPPNGGGVIANFYDNAFSLWSCNSATKTYQIFFYIEDTVSAKTYNLGNGSANYMMVTYTGPYGGSNDTVINYQTDMTHGALINFVRASDSIYSGTFAGELTNGQELFSVTDGRFDVKMGGR